MDSNQKLLSSPPPPMPPPPPPKNGNTKGHPPLVSTKLHDEGDGSVVGVGDMEGAALRRGSPRASPHELSGSGHHELYGSDCHELSGSGRHELSRFGFHELSGSSCHELSGPDRHELCRSGYQELSRSGRRLEGRTSSRSLVGCPSRDKPTAEQHGLPRRHSRMVARLGLAGLGTTAAVDDWPYTCADCSMTFGRETALSGHMRSHKRDHLSSDSEEDARTPNRRRKKRKSKLRTVTPLEATWGNRAHHNGTPRDAPAEVNGLGSGSNVIVPNIAATMPDSKEVIENNHSNDDISVIVIDNDDDDANPVIAFAGSNGAPGQAPDAAVALAMAPAPAVAMPTPTPAPHAAAASLNTEGAPVVTSTVAVTIPPAVDGPYWRIPAGAPRSAILVLPALMAPVHQPPQGTMAMAGNPVTGHFSAANTFTGWSLIGTTSSILPATPLHNQEHNPQEQIVAEAPHNHGHCSVSPSLFPFSRRQEIAVVPGNDIASSSSTPRPSIAEPSQSIGINNYLATIDAPANTMGRRLPFFLAGRSDTQALPVSWPVHHRTQGMAMDGNPLIGHFPAAISATGWSFPVTTNNVLPCIPLQNQEFNNNVAAIDALANTMPRLPFFQTGRSAIHAPPVSMPVHQPTQGMAAMAGNPVTGHFLAAMASDWFSFPATTSSVLPAIPLQTQEENPPQGRVVPTNELAGPSQNQAENPPEQTVPSNNEGRTIRLFGTNIAEGQKEVKD
ncbi:unnamed protein product [Miscanthus lutarioriparius]|uniref:C2H2-type domain-containing protein n=1 Tax=Miscanthus lutarioriparius TaxID=422564 RepID=A0A811QDG9_9POAL|nr:unnamed protein product [Miscanthus lutarioriparius]